MTSRIQSTLCVLPKYFSTINIHWASVGIDSGSLTFFSIPVKFIGRYKDSTGGYPRPTNRTSRIISSKIQNLNKFLWTRLSNLNYVLFSKNFAKASKTQRNVAILKRFIVRIAPTTVCSKSIESSEQML